jgi:SpoVK/Ycf46/Vps4 family AAA+-type ATPase
MKIQSNNPLLESITKIYENKEKLMRQPALLIELNNELQLVSKFLDLDKNFAALLSVMICEQLMGEVNSVKKIMKYMGFEPLAIINSYETIKSLKKKGWLSISKRKFHAFKTDEIEISKDLLDAITYNDKSKLVKPAPENLAVALLQIRQFISIAIGDYDLDELTETICIEIEKYTKFNFIHVIMENKKLIALEKVMIIWMATEVVVGREEFDLNNIIEIFTQDPAYTFWFKNRISNGKSYLITGGFVVFKRPNFIDFSAVNIGDKTNDLLEELHQDSETKRKTVRHCLLIEPADLSEQKLFFNSESSSNYDKVDHLLLNENYKMLMKKFQDNGMKPCLTMLFHGLPGTGKTELVKQLALKHKRNIYQVDISGIKDMWVGESEKNLKKVFKEYADALKYNKNTPILLFNEADAILGVRTNVQHAVDQMYNSLQNILLQELEDFKGIFIATTNLINNIDNAFDRRLLFKQKFDLPNAATRFDILQSQFINFNAEILKKISNDFELSGGQIQNVKRKLMADQILFGNENTPNDLLLDYVQNEIGFRQNKNKIGFN